MDVLETMTELSELDSDQRDGDGDDATPSTVAPSSGTAISSPAAAISAVQLRYETLENIYALNMASTVRKPSLLAGHKIRSNPWSLVLRSSRYSSSRNATR